MSELPTLEEALKMTGAVKCEFGPDEDECETCREPDHQLYYIRQCHEYDEGVYYCEECIKALPAEWEAMAEHWGRVAEELENKQSS